MNTRDVSHSDTLLRPPVGALTALLPACMILSLIGPSIGSAAETAVSVDGEPPGALGARIHTRQRVNETSAPLTVDAAISEAMAKSPEIQRAQAAANEARWKRNEAIGSGFLPQISVGANHYFAEKYVYTDLPFEGSIFSFPGIYPTTQLAINASVPVFNGMANVWGLQSATLAHDATEQQLSRTEFQLAQEIRLAFFQALAASELNRVAEQNVHTMEDHLRQIQIQRQGGAATNYDSLRVEVQLSEARADALDASDNVALTRKKLTQLLGLEEDSRPLQGDLPIPDATRVRSLELTGVPAERTDIQALDLQAESAAKAQSAASVWLVPQISLGGQYLFYNDLTDAIGDVNSYRGAYNFGIYLTWNLFDGGVAYSRAQQASYRTEQAERSAETARLQIPYDFAYWKKRYVANADHYSARKLDVARSEESVRLAKEEEKAGTRTATETLDAELDLFRAKAGVVNSLVNAAEAEIRLELAIGRRI